MDKMGCMIGFRINPYSDSNGIGHVLMEPEAREVLVSVALSSTQRLLYCGEIPGSVYHFAKISGITALDLINFNETGHTDDVTLTKIVNGLRRLSYELDG